MLYAEDEIENLKKIIENKDNEIKELKENEAGIKENLFKCNSLIEILYDYIVDINGFNFVKNDINEYRKMVYYYLLLENEFEPLYYFSMQDQEIYCTKEEFNKSNEDFKENET